MLSAALRVASAARSVARSTFAPTVSAEEGVVVGVVVVVVRAVVSLAGTVVSAVEVRVVLLHPVRARPATRVVNKSVFFMMEFQVAVRLTARAAVGSLGIL